MIDTVAVVSGGSPDYLIDVVADGVVRLLGRKNVCVEYSWLSHVQPTDRRFRHLYAITTGFPNEISLFDCQALIASVRVPIERIKKYRETMGGAVAILDGEDSGELKDDYLKIADVYFKREYYKEGKYPVKRLNLPGARRLIPYHYKGYPNNVLSLTFGIVPFDYGSGDVSPDKTGNVFFAGSVTSKIRVQLREMITDSGYTYMPNILNMNDYAKEVRRHWICIAPRGSGWDTYRYWEIPYLGSVVLCQNHPLKIDDDFVHDESCLRFSTVDEAKSLVEEFLQKKNRLSYIAKNGQKLVMNKHLSVHRAAKVLGAISSFAK